MIRVEQLNKQFALNKEQKKERNTSDKFAHAVKNISFECKPGEIFSLLGPNGAGKTTILRMLSTVIKPSSGSIEIGGINALSHPNEARSKIGFLTGSTGLYGRLNAHELIDYFASLYGVSNHKLDERKKQRRGQPVSWRSCKIL